MSYSEDDLAKLLANNPDVALVPDGFNYGKNPALAKMYRLKSQEPKMSEHEMQAAVFRQCAERAKDNPLWDMVVAVPNGQYRKGQRPEPGMAAGFPDIMVALPFHVLGYNYHGLFIELKVKPNKPSREQLEWHRRLKDAGYAVEVIYDDPALVIERIAEWIQFCTL